MGNIFTGDWSIIAARHNFEQWVLPRRVRDFYAEAMYFHKNGQNQKIYRRVMPDEADRGQLYPMCNTGIRLLAHFGIGVGIYFAQLVMLAVLFLIGGVILSPSINQYRSEDRLDVTNSSYSILLGASASCPPPILVQASEGCDGGGTCDVYFRDKECSITKTAIICDLVMILFISIGIIFSTKFENELKEEFDEAVQTAQDYALVVADPSPTATDPDEWFDFFSRFGKVRYITVTKRNKNLKELLKKKHLIVRNICELIGDTGNFYKNYYGGYTGLGADDLHNQEKELERRQKNMDLFEDDNFDNRRSESMNKMYKRISRHRNASTTFDGSDESSDDEEVGKAKNANYSHLNNNRNRNNIGDNNNNSNSNSKDNTINVVESTSNSNSIMKEGILDIEKLTKRLKKEKLMKLENELSGINASISLALKDEYIANQVFAIFEYEEHQRLAISELKVANRETSYTTNANSKIMFRGDNILKINEPPEPDNILWSNNEVLAAERSVRIFLCRAATIAIFVGCFYLVRHFQTIKEVPNALAIIVGAIDSILPTIFFYLSNWESPRDEGIRQQSLQVKLFGVRLLLSTIFPFLNVPWNKFLDPSNIEQNFSILIAACFTDPILKLVDVSTLTARFGIGPCLSKTQEELNNHWSGVKWTLAERYTNISKILFISLFYSLLSPTCLFPACCAFILLFLIDRFLLLRRWQQPLMIDDKVAKRMKQQALIAIVAHMYVSLRFIYSWPMDEAYFNEDKQIYIKVDKEPAWNVFAMQEQPWQTSTQKQFVPIYKVITGLLLALLFYILIGEGMIRSIHRYFFKAQAFIGETQYIGFSSLTRCPVYVPTVTVGNDTFICADIRRLDKRHYPAIKQMKGSETPDLSVYVPDSYKHCLSVVKYYDVEDKEVSTNYDQNGDIFKSRKFKKEMEQLNQLKSELDTNAESKSGDIEMGDVTSDRQENKSTMKKLGNDVNSQQIGKYLEEFRKGSNKKTSKKEINDKINNNEESAAMIDIVSSVNNLVPRGTTKLSRAEQEKTLSAMRSTFTDYIRTFVFTRQSKAVKIAPTVSVSTNESTKQHYSELENMKNKSNTLNNELIMKFGDIELDLDIDNTLESAHAATLSLAKTQKHGETRYFSFKTAGRAVMIANSNSSILKKNKIDASIKNLSHYNNDIVDLIPTFFEAKDIELMKEINKEILAHEEFDPTTVFDEEADFIPFSNFYDRLILLCPKAICAPEFKKNMKRKIENPQDIIKKQEVKLKLRHIFSQIIYMQKELLLIKSKANILLMDHKLSIAEKSLEGSISWTMFLSVLFNLVVVAYKH